MYYHASQVRGGTECYLAPEALKGDPHVTAKADMWSLGAVLVYIANDRQHLFRTQWDVFSWRGVKSPMRRQFKYPELHQLVLNLLSVDHRRRPSADQVLKDVLDHRYRQNGPCK